MVKKIVRLAFFMIAIHGYMLAAEHRGTSCCPSGENIEASDIACSYVCGFSSMAMGIPGILSDSTGGKIIGTLLEIVGGILCIKCTRDMAVHCSHRDSLQRPIVLQNLGDPQ